MKGMIDSLEGKKEKKEKKRGNKPQLKLINSVVSEAGEEHDVST